jgi:Flp pilus assembly pilin Flp
MLRLLRPIRGIARKFVRDDGQAVTEYAIVLVLIVAALATALTQPDIATTLVNKITSAVGSF